MRLWQKIGLFLVLAAMIGLIVLFWGSIFSGIMAFCIIMCLPVYLYNRFLNTDSESDFQDD